MTELSSNANASYGKMGHLSSNLARFGFFHFISSIACVLFSFILFWVLTQFQFFQTLEIQALSRETPFLWVSGFCFVGGIALLCLTKEYARTPKSWMILVYILTLLSNIITWTPLIFTVSYLTEAGAATHMMEWSDTRYKDPQAGQYVDEYYGHQHHAMLYWGNASIQEVQDEFDALNGPFQSKIQTIQNRHGGEPKVADLKKHILEWDKTFSISSCQTMVKQLPNGYLIVSINGQRPLSTLNATLNLCNHFTNNQVVIQSKPGFFGDADF